MAGKMGQYDVVVIGAGIVGMAVARELKRCGLTTVVIEKEEDVGRGASCRNSGVVHAGFNNRSGSLMAQYCVAGNRGYEAFAQMLDVPYRKTGKLVIALREEDLPIIHRLKEQGDRNGCPGLSIVGRDFIKEHEPMADGVAALWSPETAIVSSYLLPIALAENFVDNGGEIFLNSQVIGVSQGAEGFAVTCDTGLCLTGRWLINAAGLFSDRIAAMAGDSRYRLYPCRGEYHVLDKRMAGLLRMPIYPAPQPGDGGLGVHLTPSIDGNILIGPSAEYIGDAEDYGTSRAVLEKLTAEARELLPGLGQAEYIRNYSGVRPKQVDEATGGFADFVVEESSVISHLVNLIGIESPGLTAAPIIASAVAEIIGAKEKLVKDQNYRDSHRFPDRLYASTLGQRRNLAQTEPDAGEIICRCEEISKQEILQAMDNKLGSVSLKSIKYRSRAMMGRCQGGYCAPRVVKLLDEVKGIPTSRIQYGKNGTELFCGCVRGDEDE